MKTYLAIAVLMLFSVQTWAENYSPLQPSVSMRTEICDYWQWIGDGATTWGCLYRPRLTALADGRLTDLAIASLQDQITTLTARLQSLEAKNP